MNQLAKLRTIQAESLEDKFDSKGLFYMGVSYDPLKGKIFLGDPRREDLDNSNWLIDVEKLKQVKVFAAAGKVDAAKAVTKVWSNKYLQMLANKERIEQIREKESKSIQTIGERIVGAAGPNAVTDYNAIRMTGDLLAGVIGQEHTNEDYQAINIADVVNKNSVKFEYVKRTTSRIIAQRNIADDQEAMPLKHTYTTGTKEIFAYGVSFISSMRDSIDTKADVVADFKKQVPDAILAAKNEDVLTLLNAITGNNQGDWDSFSSGIPAVNAAGQVQTAEDAVKAYGRPLVCVMDSTAWRGYLQNLQGAYEPVVGTGNLSRGSTSLASSKTGTLPGNPGVTYYIDDGLTAATYVLASKPSYMKYFQAMVINTSYKNPRQAGQPEQLFWYDFAGFDEVNTSAQYKGTSVLS